MQIYLQICKKIDKNDQEKNLGDYPREKAVYVIIDFDVKKKKITNVCQNIMCDAHVTLFNTRNNSMC